MAWEQLSINKPHLAYIILGGFTSLFMLCSLFIKEKLYIGEATVATLVGVMFGPHAANLFNPLTWGNTDQITLECSRIVLVVQCFAVGVELPKAYMERHWRSVVFLLIPVMTWGWLSTSLFIWWMVPPLSWLESLACAACVTATDPVLASSVVGKGKFAKRVPKHLRDVLSAESGCNDGMAFPFIYLSLYLIKYRPDAGEVTFHWMCFTVLYECVFGAVYGFLIGYIGRHLIKSAEKKGLIDRESFLVFYFVLALFCAGSGSLLGMDDLLIGFSAGVGFSNDGWFTEKTEESHVSNVIDLLLNLTYFVYFGSIIPWDQYNAPHLGLVPWKLVIIAIFVIFFRRIPAMLALKPLIPDVKTWREALFAGHFGPIGVGAIFAAILARAELETDSTTPLEVLPDSSHEEYKLIELIWPITSFLVIASILVHGSSIAVFTLGKRINTLSITLSYTQDNENRTWMDRLPRIASQSRSMAKSEESTSSDLEKSAPTFPPDTLPPVGYRGNFLRRQKEEDVSKPGSRTSSLRPTRRRKAWDSDLRPGGKVEESAIRPARRVEPTLAQQESGSDTLNERSDEQSAERREKRKAYEEGDHSRDSSPTRQEDDDEVEIEAYEEGDQMIIEDEEGNVLRQEDTTGESPEEKKKVIEDERHKLAKETSGEHTKHKHEPHGKTEGEEIEHDVEEAVGHPEQGARKQLAKWRNLSHVGKTGTGKAGPSESQPKKKKEKPPADRKRGPAHAYQFGNTIIVEDEDGEVVKKYTIPSKKPQRGPGDQGWLKKTNSVMHTDGMHKGMKRMGTWVGLGGGTLADADKAAAQAATEAAGHKGAVDVDHNPNDPDSEDEGIRYIVSKTEQHGPFGTKKEKSGEPRPIELGGRRMSKTDFIKQIQSLDPKSRAEALKESSAPEAVKKDVRKEADISPGDYFSSAPGGRRGRSSTAPSSKPPQGGFFEPQDRPAARQRDTDLSLGDKPADSVDSLETPGSKESAEIPSGHNVSASIARYGRGSAAERRRQRLLSDVREPSDDDEAGETAAERRRRLAALGHSSKEHEESSSSSEEEEAPRQSRPKNRIQFADDQPTPSRDTVIEEEDDDDAGEEGETAAEKRRRLGALGTSRDQETSSDEDDADEPRQTKATIMFADQQQPTPPKNNMSGTSTPRGPGGGSGSASASGTATPTGTTGIHRPKISWGGERGREIAKQKEKEKEKEKEGGGGGGESEGTGVGEKVEEKIHKWFR